MARRKSMFHGIEIAPARGKRSETAKILKRAFDFSAHNRGECGFCGAKFVPNCGKCWQKKLDAANRRAERYRKAYARLRAETLSQVSKA